MSDKPILLGDSITCKDCGLEVEATLDYSSNLTVLRNPQGLACIDGDTRHPWPTLRGDDTDGES